MSDIENVGGERGDVCNTWRFLFAVVVRRLSGPEGIVPWFEKKRERGGQRRERLLGKREGGVSYVGCSVGEDSEGMSLRILTPHDLGV